MSTSSIRPIKYIFLDVEAYSNRIIEAQCDITKVLNEIVKSAINRYKISNDSLIYIPTGDGICIALLDATLPYDIHITIALEILRRIWVYNNRRTDKMRKFEVRIGINQSDDNLVEDINGRENVTGAGINNARRIMDLADASQILVGRTVYESLHYREKYMRTFRSYQARAKHDVLLEVFQYFGDNIAALNREVPSAFVPEQPPKEPSLSKVAAYYFAHSIKNRQFLLEKRGPGQQNYALRLLLWFLAVDSLGKSESTEWDPYEEHMPETTHNTLDEQFDIFMSLPFWVCAELGDLALEREGISSKYFEDPYPSLSVNIEGQNKLKSEWPAIWDEFKLGELC